MKRSVLIFASILLLSMVAMAQSRQGQGRRGGGQGQGFCPKGNQEMFERMTQQLELTDEQKSKVEAIRFRSMKSTRDIRNEIGEKEAKLRTLTTADNPDDKKINTLAKEIGNLRGDLFVKRVECKQEIRTVLNEQQKLKFDMIGDRSIRRGRKF